MGLRYWLWKLGEFQAKHAAAIFAVSLAFTVFMGVGVTKIKLQTDLSKELPEDAPPIELMRDVASKFGGNDLFIILFEVDREAKDPDRVVDIRDPRALYIISELENKLRREAEIAEVISFASNGEFSKDYSSTVIFATVDLGGKEERIKEVAELVGEDIESLPLIPGLKIRLTGTPLMRTTLMELLVSDATYTIFLSAVIILIMLIFMSRPFTRGFLIFLPLINGLTWTLGTMGWLNIPLSIATVGIGAMILGLGVEYGVFIVRGYEAERRKGRSQREALTTVISGIGTAITGSATTTIIGFLALLLASMPMIQHMGSTLALGIFYCFVAAVIVNPSFIVLEENFMRRLRHAS
jgi:hypothetical protein